jgi:hypothetical protein
MDPDAAGDPGLFCPSLQLVQHLLLEINGNHQSVLAHELGHGNRKETHAAAEVHHRHFPPNEGREDLFRLVKDPAKAIVNEVSAPPGANMTGQVNPSLSVAPNSMRKR